MTDKELEEIYLRITGYDYCTAVDRRAMRVAVDLETEELKKENERLQAVVNQIKSLPEYQGKAGCTYGDTEHDSVAAAFGYNVCLANVKHIIEPLF